MFFKMKKAIALIIAIITIVSILPITAFGAVTTSSGTRISSITPPIKVTGSETVKSYTVNYTNTDYIKAMNDYAGLVVTIKASKAGVLFMDYDIKKLGENASIEIFKESTLETSIDYEYLSTENLKGTFKFNIPQSGTYYLVFYSYASEYTDPYTNNFVIKPYIISNQNRIMEEDTWSMASYNENKTYFKFTLSSTRVVTLYSGSTDLSVTLTDSKKKPLQDYSTYLDNDNNHRTSYTLGKGSYYFCTTGYYGDSYKLKYKTTSIPSLTIGEYKKVYQANGDLNMYVKFKATASGYIRIKTKNYSGYITLCNAERDSRSPKVYVDSVYDELPPAFGVTKGKTYYLRLNNFNDYTSICVTNTKVTDQSGSSKSRAKTMSVGETYKGYVSAGSTTKDWFKFNLSSSKYWAIYVKGAANEKLKICLYKKDGTLVNTYYYYGEDAKIYSYGKFKGTYYISISRGNTKSSGYYSLKLKTSNSSLA